MLNIQLFGWLFDHTTFFRFVKLNLDWFFFATGIHYTGLHTKFAHVCIFNSHISLFLLLNAFFSCLVICFSVFNFFRLTLITGNFILFFVIRRRQSDVRSDAVANLINDTAVQLMIYRYVILCVMKSTKLQKVFFSTFYVGRLTYTISFRLLSFFGVVIAL